MHPKASSGSPWSSGAQSAPMRSMFDKTLPLRFNVLFLEEEHEEEPRGQGRGSQMWSRMGGKQNVCVPGLSSMPTRILTQFASPPPLAIQSQSISLDLASSSCLYISKRWCTRGVFRAGSKSGEKHCKHSTTKELFTPTATVPGVPATHLY